MKILVHCSKCGFCNSVELPKTESSAQMFHCDNCDYMIFQLFETGEIKN